MIQNPLEAGVTETESLSDCADLEPEDIVAAQWFDMKRIIG
jgi:uncharacterized protein (DUF433 family)